MCREVAISGFSCRDKCVRHLIGTCQEKVLIRNVNLNLNVEPRRGRIGV